MTGIQALQRSIRQIRLEPVGLLANPLQCAPGADSIQPAHKTANGLIDIRQGQLCGVGALLHVLVDDLLEIVDRVQVHVLEPGDRGFDIAGYGDIDQEHRAVAAPAQGRLDVGPGNHVPRAGRGTDQDVRARERLVEPIQRHGAGLQFLRQFLGRLAAAVQDQQLGDIMVAEVASAQLHHFPGAHQHHRVAVQVAEDLPGEHDGRVGHRHGVIADAGTGADVLGGRESMLEQAIQHRPQRAGLVRLLPGLFQLAQDLRFAQHQRVQSAGDADQVAGRFLAFVRVEVLVQFTGWYPVRPVHPVQQCFLAILRRKTIDFRAVAGAQDQDLFDAGQGAQLADSRSGRCDG
jgi:hypothetical protein